MDLHYDIESVVAHSMQHFIESETSYTSTTSAISIFHIFDSYAVRTVVDDMVDLAVLPVMRCAKNGAE